MTSLNFNPQDHEPAGGGVGLPISNAKGWLVRIISHEVQEDTNGMPKSCAYKVVLLPDDQATDTSFFNQEFDVYFNLFHSNEDARRIAQQELTSMCYSVYYTDPLNGPEIYGRECRIVVVPQKADKDGTPSRFTNKRFLDSSGAKVNAADALKNGTTNGGPSGGQQPNFDNQQANPQSGNGQVQQNQNQNPNQNQQNPNQQQGQQQWGFDNGSQPQNNGGQGQWNNGGGQQQNPNQNQNNGSQQPQNQGNGSNQQPWK